MPEGYPVGPFLYSAKLNGELCSRPVRWSSEFIATDTALSEHGPAVVEMGPSVLVTNRVVADGIDPVIVAEGTLTLNAEWQDEGGLWHGQAPIELIIGVASPALGPAIWLDASDSATLIVTDGKLSQWSDKSGHERHARQPSLASAPTLQTVEGQQRVAFDGHQVMLTPSESETTGVDGLSVFTVLSSTSTASNAGPCGKWGSAVEPQRWISMLKSSSGAQLPLFYIGGSGVSQTIGANDGTTHMLEGVRSAETVDGWVDGGDHVVSPAGVVEPATLHVSIGSVYTDGTGFMTGTIAELLIFSRALTETDRQIVEGYLAHKWLFAANLPADHPYKDAAPTNVTIL